MTREPSRRYFLQTAATAGTALGLGEWVGLLPLTPATADAKVTPDLIRFSADIEPIVRLIEETPRAKCPDMMIEQLKSGLPYRQFLAAMFLAGLRNRALGGHHIALLHSANQLALDAPAAERLLPTFWALDSFKADLDRRRPTPTLMTFSGRLPAADKAEEELHAAMEAQDADRAERAVVALARTQGVGRMIEPLWRYGARDWVFIGHSAIWMANNWRTLQTVGEQHAEPTLRYLVREMIDTAQGVGKETYAASRERVRETLDKLPADWGQATGTAGLTKELLTLLRENKGDDACRFAVAQLREGKAKAGAVWDAVHVAAAHSATPWPCTRTPSRKLSISPSGRAASRPIGCCSCSRPWAGLACSETASGRGSAVGFSRRRKPYSTSLRPGSRTGRPPPRTRSWPLVRPMPPKPSARHSPSPNVSRTATYSGAPRRGYFT